MSKEVVIADGYSPQQRDSDWWRHIARALFENEFRIVIGSQSELDTLVKQAKDNKALARTISRVETTNTSLVPKLHAVISDIQNRLDDALRLLSNAQRICTKGEIPFVVIKSLDALPDIGHDIDLLVGANLQQVKNQLLREFRCSPVTLTFCDRQAGKFSSFVQGYSSDLELYAAISQLGEQYYAEGGILERRYWDKDLNGGTYLCSFEDRLLITCIHALYRHGSIRLSDLKTVHRSFCVNFDLNYVLETVESSGIKEGFAIFMRVLEKVGRDTLGSELLPAQVRSYANEILKDNRLLAMLAGRLHTRFPLHIPVWITTLLFLHKAWADLAHSKPRSFVRAIIAPVLLLMYKAIPLNIQKAIGAQIW